MDDSLDDFFAKKDKSKKKSKSSKSKFVPADLLPPGPGTALDEGDGAVQLGEQFAEVKIDDDQSETMKEKKKSRKKKDKDSLEESRRREDDEWHAVDEEKDYSGLRIATKNIAKEADEDQTAAGDSDVEYDEHGKPRPSEQGGVWKRVSPVEPDQDADSEQSDSETHSKQEAPAPAEPAPATTGRYIPPSMRAAAQSNVTRTPDGNLKPVSIKRTPRTKVAPNISSQEDFPSLGAAPPPTDVDTSNFERVRGGGSGVQSNQRSAASSQQVETTNMYSLLQQRN